MSCAREHHSSYAQMSFDFWDKEAKRTKYLRDQAKADLEKAVKLRENAQRIYIIHEALDQAFNPAKVNPKCGFVAFCKELEKDSTAKVPPILLRNRSLFEELRAAKVKGGLDGFLKFPLNSMIIALKLWAVALGEDPMTVTCTYESNHS